MCVANSKNHDKLLPNCLPLQYIAQMLLKINERRQWTDPPPEDPVKRALQDEEIFQTARLVKYVVVALVPCRSH